MGVGASEQYPRVFLGGDRFIYPLTADPAAGVMNGYKSLGTGGKGWNHLVGHKAARGNIMLGDSSVSSMNNIGLNLALANTRDPNNNTVFLP